MFKVSSEYVKLRNELSNLKQLRGGKSAFKAVPSEWSNFAQLTTIRSGKGYEKFTPYEYQEKLIELVTDNFGTVILKSRQLGISETIINWIIFRCLETPGCNAVCFSLNQQATSKLAKRCRLMIESIPAYASLKTDSQLELTFQNGSTIYFRNASINGSRGLESVSILFFDEFAFIPEAGEIYKSALPSTSMLANDARVIINSTPDKESGDYYERLNSDNPQGYEIKTLVERIRTGEIGNQYWTCPESGWAKAILHWRSHPIYSQDENYLETVSKRFSLDPETVNREYDLSFSSSSTAVFSAEIINKCFKGELNKSHNKDCDYYIGVDCASSLSKNSDYFVACVIEYNPKTEVLRLVDYYRDRGQTISYHVFQTSKLIQKYSPHRVAIETNAMGQAVLETLQTSNPSVQIEGLTTTQQSKANYVTKLIVAMESERLAMPDSQVIIKEFLSFSSDGKSMKASSGHDDFVMSVALANFVAPSVRYSGTLRVNQSEEIPDVIKLLKQKENENE